MSGGTVGESRIDPRAAARGARADRAGFLSRGGVPDEDDIRAARLFALEAKRQ
jgi:hypothetical protein